MRRFRFDTVSELTPGMVVELEKSERDHLFKILRAREGDVCELMDGRGSVASAKVGPGRSLTVTGTRKPEPLRGPRLHLYMAPPRRQKTDLILKQCVELGVARIAPVICERSVSQPDSDSVSGRWDDLLFEACKQSGNPFKPELGSVTDFKSGLADARARCAFCCFGSVERTTDRFANAPGVADAALFVGPEGGFSPDEEAAFAACGFVPLHLESWILRAETAAVCGLAVLRDRLAL